MARSYEQSNFLLTQQNNKMESDTLNQAKAMSALRVELESANTRATAEVSRADREAARADAATANAARALESEGKARAETEIAVTETEKAQATAEAAQDAFARSESALAAAQEASDRASASASARAFAEIAQAKAAATKAREALFKSKEAASKSKELASKAQQENLVLRSALEALARQVRGETRSTKAGRRRGKGGAAVAAAAAVSSLRGTSDVIGREGSRGDVLGQAMSRDGDDANRLLNFVTGFCGLVLTGTGRELPPDVLQRFLAPAASRDVVKHDDSDESAPQSTGEGLIPREDVSVRREEPAATSTCCVSSPPAAAPPAAAATPGETYRATNTRRELLNARKAQKEREAQRIAEEREKERAERARDAREKRERAGRQATSQAHHARSPQPRQWVSTPQFLHSRQHQHQHQQGGGVGRQRKACRTQQEQMQEAANAVVLPGGGGGDCGSSSGTKCLAVAELPATPLKPSALHEAQLSAAVSPERRVAGAHNRDGSTAVATPPIGTTTGDHEDAGVEEVPMPAGEIDEHFCAGVYADPDGGLFATDAATAAAGGVCGEGVTQEASVAAVEGATTEEVGEERAGGAAPELEPLVGFVVGGEDLVVPGADENADEMQPTPGSRSGEAKKRKDGKSKRRRSMRCDATFLGVLFRRLFFPSSHFTVTCRKYGHAKTLCVVHGYSPPRSIKCMAALLC